MTYIYLGGTRCDSSEIMQAQAQQPHQPQNMSQIGCARFSAFPSETTCRAAFCEHMKQYGRIVGGGGLGLIDDDVRAVFHSVNNFLVNFTIELPKNQPSDVWVRCV